MYNYLTSKNLWNDLFEGSQNGRVFGLKADVIESDKNYEIIVNMPGYKKEEISVSLENGYLTISGEISKDNNEEASDKKYIRRERFVGLSSRSFYLGDGYTEEDINAKLENGVLTVVVAKEIKNKETKKVIEIK